MKGKQTLYQIGDKGISLFCHDRKESGWPNAYHILEKESDDCVILYKEELLEILKAIEEFELEE